MTAGLIRIDLMADGAVSQQIVDDRKVAIFDLIEQNHFVLCAGPAGPYVLKLSLERNDVIFDVSTADGRRAACFMVSMQGLQQSIKDYSRICESYYDAVKSEPPARIELLDEARRAIHLEGARQLSTQMADKVEVDLETARRLFTLICAIGRTD